MEANELLENAHHISHHILDPAHHRRDGRRGSDDPMMIPGTCTAQKRDWAVVFGFPPASLKTREEELAVVDLVEAIGRREAVTSQNNTEFN